MTEIAHGIDNDETLAEWAKAGRREAFGELLERHRAALTDTLLGILRDPDAAEETAQLAFVKAFESLASFEGRSRFKTWLWRIALNEAWRRQSSAKRRETVDIDTFLPNLREASADETGELERKIDLEKSMEALTPREREFVELRLEGYSMAEIGTRLGISVGTVKSTLFDAERRLRRAALPLRVDLDA